MALINQNIPCGGFGTYGLKGEIAYISVLNAIKNGYRHIDTASIYKNEEYVGKAISDSGIARENLTVSTKIWFDAIEKGRNGIIDGIKESLKKLKLDYIDILYLHGPKDGFIVNSWKTMEEVYEGKIQNVKVKYIGVCNYDVCHLEQVLDNCKIKPFVNQIEISPYLNRDDLVTYCNKHNIIIVAHSSLTKGKKFDDIKLISIAKRLNTTPAVVLLCWALCRGFKVIPRSSKEEHIIENIKSISLILSNEIIEELNKFDEQFSTHPRYIMIKK